MSHGSWWSAVLLVLGAGCALKPIDPWRCGAWALERCDLDGALAAFEAVPLQHLRYPESRTAALAVQRTMRHCDELLRDAMQLRIDGRDAEALAVLHRVRELWLEAPGLNALLADTERRQRLARSPLPPVPAPSALAAQPPRTTPAVVVESEVGRVEPPPAALPEPESALPEPQWMARTTVQPAAVAATIEVAIAPVPALSPERAPELPVPAPMPQGARSAAGGDAITAAMIALEARLVRGERDGPIAQMLELAQQHPDELRVRVRVSRLLHQRALVRYGDGELAGAIADWQQVLALDPGHATAATLLRAVELEARQIGRGIK